MAEGYQVNLHGGPSMSSDLLLRNPVGTFQLSHCDLLPLAARY